MPKKDLKCLFKLLPPGQETLTQQNFVFTSSLSTKRDVNFSALKKYMKEIHLLEPMGYSHHHIERSQEENKVEVGITVHCALLLIINHSLASPFFNVLFSISCKRQETTKVCKCNEN